MNTNAQPQLDSLLLVWQEANDQGRDLDPTELCHACPELLPELRRQIDALRRLNALAYGTPQNSDLHNATTARGESGTIPPSGTAATANLIAEGVPGYEVLEVLGRGGMGVVYKARQVGLGRLCALKMVLAGGHASAVELARFRTEAEAIARLQHPGIVQVFEIGEHQGRPFLTLEYCPGGSLDRKLAGTPLPPVEAAQLLRALAEAMQAAHQANVLHRDLKPANVLLTADGKPKVSDFGLARKLDEAGQTHTGSVMGTPAYMSPEQAQGKKEVGPRTDVYALGAILYECLTGRPPFKAATPLDTMMLVMNQEPVPPRDLNARVPADLETIALKCLHKAPERRYASAQDLADDLERWLAGDPIRARRTGRLERLWRWARKSPAVASLTAAVALLLIGATAVSWALAARAERNAERAQEEARRADAKAAEAEKNAQLANDNAQKAAQNERLASTNERRAREESQRAHRSLAFLTDLFRVSDPLEFAGYGLRGAHEKGRNLTARDLLDRGAKQLTAELKDQPLVRASLLLTIGDVYRSMGHYDRASPLLREAVLLRKKQLGETHPDHARALYFLGWNHLDQGDYDTAEDLFRRAMNTQEEKLGRDDPATVDTRMHLAWVFTMYSDARSIPLLKQVIAARTKRYSAQHHQTIIAKGVLAAAYLDHGMVSEAVPLIADAVSYSSKVSGGKNNLRAATLFQGGVVQAGVGFHSRAQRSYEACLKLVKQQVGDDHYYLALVLHELAMSLWKQGKLADAEKQFRECLRVARASVGLEHPRATVAIGSYSSLLIRLKRPQEALRLWAEAEAINRKRFGPNNRSRFWYLAPRARLEARHGSAETAAELAREALRVLPRTAGKEGLKIDRVTELGWALYHGNIDQALAERCFEAGARICRETGTGGNEELAGALVGQGAALHALSRYREAGPVLREAEKKGQGTWVVRDWPGFRLYRQLGDVNLAEGQFSAAAEHYRQALAVARKSSRVGEGAIIDALIDQVSPWAEQGNWDRAITAAREAASYKRDGQVFNYDTAVSCLVLVQQAAGRLAEARTSANLLAGIFWDHPSANARLLAANAILLVFRDDLDLIRRAMCLLVGAREGLPNDARVVDALILAHLRLGQPDEAEALLKKGPSRPSFAVLYRAWIEHLRGRDTQARALHATASAQMQGWQPGPESLAKRVAMHWQQRLEFRLLHAELRSKLDPTVR